MKINYDKIADAIYFRIRNGSIKKSIRMNDRVVVDVDNNGSVIGIELLDASSQQGIKNLEKTIREGIPVNVVSATPIVA